jgi:glyoxylase-like metal-dependent hydrolase (beta-lactamase superfamily II)
VSLPNIVTIHSLYDRLATVTNPPVLIAAHNPSAMTGLGNNTYLITSADGHAMLIDAGVGQPQHLAELDEQLASERCTLARVLVTHGHADHASGAPMLASSHPGSTFAKYPWPEEDAKYDVAWQPLADGEAIRVGDDVLTAVYTPGHSPDHLSFWHEPTRTIFTGDLVIPGGSVMIHTSRGGNLAQYFASLERLLALEPLVLLPAHGGRIDNPAHVIRGHLEHRRMRERQVVDALAAGHATVEAIAGSIYDGLDPALLPAARENVRAHLDKLEADGVARAERGAWRLLR